MIVIKILSYYTVCNPNVNNTKINNWEFVFVFLRTNACLLLIFWDGLISPSPWAKGQVWLYAVQIEYLTIFCTNLSPKSTIGHSSSQHFAYFLFCLLLSGMLYNEHSIGHAEEALWGIRLKLLPVLSKANVCKPEMLSSVKNTPN